MPKPRQQDFVGQHCHLVTMKGILGNTKKPEKQQLAVSWSHTATLCSCENCFQEQLDF